MTREQQRKFKELQRTLSGMLKEKIKEYKFKKKDYMIWFCKDDLFYDLMIHVAVPDDGRCICSAVETLKPLWLDELLWDFLNMPDNKKEPYSLRAIGAFTVEGSQIYKECRELANWDVRELEQCVDAYLEHFSQTIRTGTTDDFYTYLEASPYHVELRRSLSLIHQGQHQEALAYLKDKGQGIFCNAGIWINEAMREYCKTQ